MAGSHVPGSSTIWIVRYVTTSGKTMNRVFHGREDGEIYFEHVLSQNPKLRHIELSQGILLPPDKRVWRTRPA